MSGYATAIGAALLAAHVLAAGDFLNAIPKVVTSSDGFVKVVAADVPGDDLGYRTPLLTFATHVVHDLSAAYALELPRRARPGLIVYAEDGTTNDVRVIVRVRRTGGETQTRIWLPSPGFSDIEKLRVEVGKAFFRAWFSGGTERLRDANAAVDELPDWLVQGAFRAADVERLRADRRFTLQLWRSGRLPFFPTLCTDLRVSQGQAAALCGYVAGWMNEKRLFEKWLRRLAEGHPWDGKRLAVELTGETDPALQDRANDERMIKFAHGVLAPGRTSAADLETFASRLFLYPARFDAFPCCSFRAAAGEAGTNVALRAAADEKARRLPTFAIGRDATLQEACWRYKDFLDAVAKGEPEEKREGLLNVADTAFFNARAAQEKTNGL